jgi:hypothetical protein
MPRTQRWVVLMVVSALAWSCNSLADGAGSSPTPATTDPGGAPAIGPEDQAVYAAVLAQKYLAPSYVIRDATRADAFFGPLADTVSVVLQQMHGVAMQTSASFLARNAQSQPLRPEMSLGAPYVLLTDLELKQLFDSPPAGVEAGWQAFYARYPDAHGIITLSRVGFNAAGDQALVYVGNQYAELGGEGIYFLLNRVGTDWLVDQQALTWIS